MMKTSRSYSVYKHTSPNGKIYIGITSISPEKRWGGGSGYARNAYFANSIKKYGWDSFEHEVLYSDLSADEAEAIERRLIHDYRSNDKAYGFNLTNGGEIGKRHAQETIEKMSRAKKGKYVGELNLHFGKENSPETRRKISEALKGKLKGEKNPNFGKTMSDEQKRKIGDSRRGKHYPKLSESLRNSEIMQHNFEKQKKSINQYDKEGNFIRRWESAPDAAESLIGRRSAQSNICSCANHNLSTAYGYIWRYCDEDEGGGDDT